MVNDAGVGGGNAAFASTIGSLSAAGNAAFAQRSNVLLERNREARDSGSPRILHAA